MRGIVFYQLQVKIYCIGKGYLFRTCRRLIVSLPKGEYQCFDTLSLFNVKHPIISVERVKSNGIVLGISKVNPILSFSLVVNKLTNPLVGVPCIY